MRTPLVVVTGVHSDAMDSAMVSLSWGSPHAVAVRHRIDPESQILTRIVSDATGILEREETALEHACVTCALRVDIVPTLERLGREDRWSTIVSCLPTGTEADHLASVLIRDTRLARHVRLSSVVAAVGTQRLVEDLLSDELLREHGMHSNPGDRRGLGEVACGQIEFADTLALEDDPGPEATDLVLALAQPDALLVAGVDQLDGHALTAQHRQHTHSAAWSSPTESVQLPDLSDSHSWRLELSSSRALHPERLLDNIERLGYGRHRSRGCFWVPTRSSTVLQWSGAGGQLSIGGYSSWGRRAPLTRLILTGLGTAPAGLRDAFEEVLITPSEARQNQGSWDVVEDGLEPWLGDIRDVA